MNLAFKFSPSQREAGQRSLHPSSTGGLPSDNILNVQTGLISGHGPAAFRYVPPERRGSLRPVLCDLCCHPTLHRHLAQRDDKRPTVSLSRDLVWVVWINLGPLLSTRWQRNPNLLLKQRNQTTQSSSAGIGVWMGASLWWVLTLDRIRFVGSEGRIFNHK